MATVNFGELSELESKRLAANLLFFLHSFATLRFSKLIYEVIFQIKCWIIKNKVYFDKYYGVKSISFSRQIPILNTCESTFVFIFLNARDPLHKRLRGAFAIASDVVEWDCKIKENQVCDEMKQTHIGIPLPFLFLIKFLMPVISLNPQKFKPCFRLGQVCTD